MALTPEQQKFKEEVDHLKLAIQEVRIGLRLLATRIEQLSKHCKKVEKTITSLNHTIK